VLASPPVNGWPGDSFGDCSARPGRLRRGARVRIGGLRSCFDALVPLGDQACRSLTALLGAANRRSERCLAYRRWLA